MSRFGLTRFFLGACVLTLLFLLLRFVLFRTVVEYNSALGILRYCYRWGTLSVLTCDRNADGVIDARLRILSPTNSPSTAFVVLEGWESSRLDGQFDVHYQEIDGVLHLELDDDGDGRVERTLVGDSASEELRRRTSELPH
jgi:hypothetical protein